MLLEQGVSQLEERGRGGASRGWTQGHRLYQGTCDPLWEEMSLSETYSVSKPAVLSITDNQSSLF